jgi:hypothetical protein
MEPALKCWEWMSEPFPSDSRYLITDIAFRSLSLVGLVFSSALFIPGLVLKSIEHVIASLVNLKPGEIFTQTITTTQEPTTTTQEPPVTSQPASSVTQNEESTSLATQPASVTQDALDDLVSVDQQMLYVLRSVAGAFSQQAFNTLRLPLKSLIATRYLILDNGLGSLFRGPRIVETFEDHFRSGFNRTYLNQALQQAVQLQENILFADRLLRSLERGEDITSLANENPELFGVIKHCIWKKHGCPLNRGSDFGGEILREYPTHADSTRAVINKIKLLWQEAHTDIIWFDFLNAC